MCRSRREHSNAYLLAKFGFDTAENEPFQVCSLSAYRSPRLMNVAELAKQAVEDGYAGESKPRKVAISSVPRWVTNTGVWLATKVTSQKTYGPVHFISEASKHDMSAPNFGTKRLLDYYREKVEEHKKKEAEAKK